MRAAPNLGTDYGKSFERIYPELAAKYGVLLYPFFLDGVAADLSLTQPDGMHPNAAGVNVIVGAHPAEDGGTYCARSRAASIVEGCAQPAIPACCRCCDSPTWTAGVMPRLFTAS